MTLVNRPRVVLGLAIGAILSTAAQPLVAQEIAASEFTTDNVNPQAPFAGLPIDRSRIERNLENIEAFLLRFSEEQLLELQQRCVVITENEELYDDPSVRLCEAVLAAAAE